MGLQRTRFPACTHITMDRVYGRNQQCHVCGRSPSIGFLYECRQDSEKRETLEDLISQHTATPPPKSELRLQLEDAGLSEGIIQNAERGGYTDSQLQLLTSQKKTLRQTIASSSQKDNNRITAQLKAPGVYATDGSSSSKPAPRELPCVFKACHTCRPYYKDRVSISFPDLVSGRFSPLNPEDKRSLPPVKSAEIMRRVGTRTNPQPTAEAEQAYSPSSFQTTESNSAESNGSNSANTCPSTHSDTLPYTISTAREKQKRNSLDIARHLARRIPPGKKSSLLQAIKGILRSGGRNHNDQDEEGMDQNDLTNDSHITLPVRHTGLLRNPLDHHVSFAPGDFDISFLRRIRRQKERVEVCRGTYVCGFENVCSFEDGDGGEEGEGEGGRGLPEEDEDVRFADALDEEEECVVAQV